jgi:membrane associated rhomboid family serine protease
VAQTSYRHPNRETAVSCSGCGRPICPDCMTPSPVGMRCPECATHRTKVRAGPAAFSPSSSAMPATFVLIALNVLAFLPEIAAGHVGFFTSYTNSVMVDFGLFAPAVANGEVYRILTAGFMHGNFLHIAVNMYALYIVGRLLEPAIGTLRFTVLYFVSLLAGSFGALLLTPNTLTIGASGAIFGIFAAAFVIARGRRLEGVAAQLGVLLLINFAFTLGVPGISIGGHLFGAAGGALCALVIVAGERGRFGTNRLPAEMLGMVALGVFSVVGCLAVV